MKTINVLSRDINTWGFMQLDKDFKIFQARSGDTIRWTKCRDILVWYTHLCLNQVVNLDKIRLALSVCGYNTDAHNKIYSISNVINLLNEVENKLGFELTEVHSLRINDNTNIGYVFEGDKRWLLSPVMLSTYVLLIRCGWFSKEGTSLDDLLSGTAGANSWDDFTTIHTYRTTIDMLIQHGPEQLFNSKNMPFKDILKHNYDTVHDTNYDIIGLTSYAKGHCKKLHPKWYSVCK